MAGALIFVGVVFSLIFWGTLLLQAAIVAVQVAAWLAVWTFRITFGVVGLLVFGVWRVVDEDAATRAWRGAASGQPAPWARGL